MLQHSLLLGQSGCRRPCTLQQPCVRQARLATPVQALKGFGLPAITNQKKNKCPCGSGSEYADCCQKLHKVQQLKPTSPEQLLRARFAAYVKKDYKYVLRTTHSANPARQGSISPTNPEIKTSFEQDVKVTMRWAEMSNLTIVKVQPGTNPEQAEIDFQYNMRQLYELATGERITNPANRVIKETAVFELEEGEWRALGSRTNWDRNKLQEVVPGAA